MADMIENSGRLAPKSTCTGCERALLLQALYMIGRVHQFVASCLGMIVAIFNGNIGMAATIFLAGGVEVT
jgi:hypothetical protein